MMGLQTEIAKVIFGGRNLKTWEGSDKKANKILAKMREVVKGAELTILQTNPYWDAPDSACEGIYEAGKEAQLESDQAQLQAILKAMED